MVTVGLLGHEYDECVNRLKAAIEDRGHRARVVNLQHLPRVTRATVDLGRIVYDGYDLLEMDCFFLREMDVRDPFFHVWYSAELWEMLRERYLSFAEEEIDNLLFARNIVWILADRKTVVNHPRIYEHRNQMPFHLSELARRGCSTPRFLASRAEESFDGASGEVPIRLDEERTWDVFTFPKGKRREVTLRVGEGAEAVYRLIVLGERSLDHAVELPRGGGPGRLVPGGELPAGAAVAALRAARSLGAVFAEVELECGGGGEAVLVRRVDPSPEFSRLEDAYRLSISEPLAEYLVAAAGPQRA